MYKLIKKIKVTTTVVVISMVMPVFSGCTPAVQSKSSNKLSIVASLYPQYDFARQIAGEKAEVTMIFPPGAESHTYEPSPSDIIKINKADLFLYTGKYMEPWADRLTTGIAESKVTVVDVSAGVGLYRSCGGYICDDDCCCCEAHDHNVHEHQHEYDPHIWLDPTLAIAMIDNITLALCEKDPEYKSIYEENAKNYKTKIWEFDKQVIETVKNSKRSAIVFAGRFAHRYFINRYGLSYRSAFDSCSSESEPGARRIAEIVNFIKENDIPCVYYEELTQPKVAESVVEQTGTCALKFSTIHNITKEQMEKGITYLDLMRENLENLKRGLN